jgi:hypothetical protein
MTVNVHTKFSLLYPTLICSTQAPPLPLEDFTSVLLVTVGSCSTYSLKVTSYQKSVITHTINAMLR